MQDRGAWWATVHRVTESDTTEATKHARINTTDYSSVMEKTETHGQQRARMWGHCAK